MIDPVAAEIRQRRGVSIEPDPQPEPESTPSRYEPPRPPPLNEQQALERGLTGKTMNETEPVPRPPSYER